jgi:hypothetical protein
LTEEPQKKKEANGGNFRLVNLMDAIGTVAFL